MRQNKDFQKGVELAFDRAGKIIDQIGQTLAEAREALLEMPAPCYSASTANRRDQLNGPSKWIFEDVVNAMQNAEEIGGPEAEEYFELMRAIVEEATHRIECYSQLRK